MHSPAHARARARTESFATYRRCVRRGYERHVPDRGHGRAEATRDVDGENAVCVAHRVGRERVPGEEERGEKDARGRRRRRTVEIAAHRASERCRDPASEWSGEGSQQGA